jgi:hypothetical protein
MIRRPWPGVGETDELLWAFEYRFDKIRWAYHVQVGARQA